MLIAAIALITLGHVARVLRWRQFINVYEYPETKSLCYSLSIGYLINFFIPFKLGDLFRALLSGRKMKSGRALGLSTVIVDRYLDVVVVGVIFVFLSFLFPNENVVSSATMYIFMAVGILALTCLVFVFRNQVKKLIRAVAGLFNNRIETMILRVGWALIWNFKDMGKKLNKFKLIGETILMWSLYLGSYSVLSKFLTSIGDNRSTIDVFLMLFSDQGLKSSTGTLTTSSIYMIIYMMVPLAILLLASLAMKGRLVDKGDYHLNLLPQLDPEERLNFLERYFESGERDYIDNYLKVNRGISIIRDYSAGSNATTILCLSDEGTFFRKYAFGQDAKKLYQQIEWISKYNNELPLPAISKYESDESCSYYDMPCVTGAVGMFEFVHTSGAQRGITVLRKALGYLENSIYAKEDYIDSDANLTAYIKTKVTDNIAKIKNSKRFRDLCEYDDVVINGTTYKNLPYYEDRISEESLSGIFKADKCGIIHGDLTIENIICTYNDKGEDDCYLIDPNTGNVHNAKALDYAKLLQSLHGGYEFLSAVRKVEVDGNTISFINSKSQAYIEMYKEYKEYLTERFSKEEVKSIYYHEIVHWLRLMPYKINKDPEKAVIFYAGLIMVLNDVIEEFG